MMLAVHIRDHMFEIQQLDKLLTIIHLKLTEKCHRLVYCIARMMTPFL